MKFTIIDLETTGFSFKSHDRIIELSLISIDDSGHVIDTLDTLLNPRRDTGCVRVHGITPQMVSSAPTFEELAPHVLDIISDSIVVAHNARFDTSFLNHELARAGFQLPPIKGLCTMDLSGRLLPELSSRKLSVLCDYLDIPLEHAHRAYHDCLATKEVFLKLYHHYQAEHGPEGFLSPFLAPYRLPQGTPCPTGARPTQAREQASLRTQEADNRLKRMIHRLPAIIPSSDIPIQAYLDILDDILADRIVTTAEAQRLFELSESYGISAAQALEIHETYLHQLIRLYLLDGTMTSNLMKQDLEKVAALLGIPERLDTAIKQASSKVPIPESPTPTQPTCAGQTVCFTGELCGQLEGRTIDRALAQELARARGLIVKSSVSRKLDLLVLADPHSQSTKARKARELGIKLMAETTFWHMLGIRVS